MPNPPQPVGEDTRSSEPLSDWLERHGTHALPAEVRVLERELTAAERRARQAEKQSDWYRKEFQMAFHAQCEAQAKAEEALEIAREECKVDLDEVQARADSLEGALRKIIHLTGLGESRPAIREIARKALKANGQAS